MAYSVLEQQISRMMPHHLKLTVIQHVPLYLQLQGKPKRYKPYVVEIKKGYATSAFDIHEDYATEHEALRAGMRRIIDYLQHNQS